ncbi:MAG: acyl-CoA dehydratase activase-related protein [Clostridia bacterium]|nr:acyl-CoA dehydratase activase-related protein [Clostridia bacterium]
MGKKVGIPRGLFYYQYYPLWKAFLEELGAEIIVSDQTTKKILDDGVKSCVDEACLPVKVFHGHIINIKDKVDYLFIPRFTSVSKNEYICPKFGGLPDMVRHTFSNLPQIIDVEVNMRKSKSNSLKAALDAGKYFTDSRQTIENAYINALKAYNEHKAKIKNGTNPFGTSNRKINKHLPYDGRKLNVAVIGHVYNVYDSYLNMDMLCKLEGYGVNVITVDMMDESLINEKSGTLNKRMFWNFGSKAMGSALHILDRQDIDGVIFLMSFGCGIDSFVADLAERKLRRARDIPLTILTIDEHSGEAGMDTRLEAFIDMIRWRGKNETDISAHG